MGFSVINHSFWGTPIEAAAPSAGPSAGGAEGKKVVRSKGLFGGVLVG